MKGYNRTRWPRRNKRKKRYQNDEWMARESDSRVMEKSSCEVDSKVWVEKIQGINKRKGKSESYYGGIERREGCLFIMESTD